MKHPLLTVLLNCFNRRKRCLINHRFSAGGTSLTNSRVEELLSMAPTYKLTDLLEHVCSGGDLDDFVYFGAGCVRRIYIGLVLREMKSGSLRWSHQGAGSRPQGRGLAPVGHGETSTHTNELTAPWARRAWGRRLTSIERLLSAAEV